MALPRVLFVGVGGLGCPAARALVGEALELVLLDDDVVDETNLHRQVLYEDADVGRPKAVAAAERLRALGARCEAREARFLPSDATKHLRGIDLVVEGSDNFATKFLVADACAQAGVRVVHGGAVAWNGWALAVDPRRSPHAPCLRCVFEDVPDGSVPTCADVGVLGPVVGVLGALQARLARELLAGRAHDPLLHYRGLEGRLRSTRVRARYDCPLQDPHGFALVAERYVSGCG
ncbi:MAG: ThiF family adenylyltransferase [Sandaracinus sp.]|nr:ThiF family adenylyltransferase [Sandaracinus sp.]MCB9622619.1 ThiF family adenylyltransferase [Sandaracinus sp.]